MPRWAGFCSSRASWSTVLPEPVLSGGTDINCFNFTRGTDGWDPLPELIAGDTNNYIPEKLKETEVKVYSNRDHIYISNVHSSINIHVYNVNGSLVRSLETKGDINFPVDKGLWLVSIRKADSQRTTKIISL